MEDGYEKFFVVLTRPQGYRKEAPTKNLIIKNTLGDHPNLVEAILTRHDRYNEDLDLLEKLKAEGKAYIVYAEDQSVENTEMDLHKLQNNYELGYFQGLNQYREYLDFVGLK